MDLLTVLGQRRFDTLWHEASRVFPVTRFEAHGNGIDDDYGPIQRAITAATAAGGGTVLLPRGIYRTSLRPSVTACVKIVGDGASLTAATSPTVIKPDAGVGGLLIDTNTAAGTVVEDIYFDSQSTGSGTDDGIAVSAPRCKIIRCAANGFGRYGIFNTSAGGRNANLNLFAECRTANNKSDGWKSDGVNDGGTVDSNNAVVIQLDSTGNGGWGMNVGGAAALILKPQIAGNSASAGSMRFSGNSPMILHPYIESDSGKYAVATATSAYGYWLSGQYGGILPDITAATPKATWEVRRLGAFEHAIRLADEQNAGKSYELSSGQVLANAWGLKNTTDGQYHLYGATDAVTGKMAHLAIPDASILMGVYSDRSWVSVTTTDATPTILKQFALTADTAQGITAEVTAKQVGGTGCAKYIVECLASNDGGVVTLHGQTPLATHETDATWDATFVVSSNTLRLQVTGAAATTINWFTTLEVVQQ